MTRLHAGETRIDLSLVEHLVRTQAPQFGGMPLDRVESMGTVNAIFRLGHEHCVRLPRIERYAESLERELAWLPRLAPRLSLQIPEPVVAGAPDHGYPFTWAIYRWIDGQTWSDEIIDDEAANARGLARFVTELRRIPAAGGPPGGRRPLRQLDDLTRKAIAACGATIDCAAAVSVWTNAIDAPPWNGADVWIHTDLLRPNLLIHDGRLSAVIDFGSAGVGDPAADLICAWSVFGPAGRAAFREIVGADDLTWRRSQAYALHQAAMIIPYYRETNPGFVALAGRTIAQVLLDTLG